MFREITVSKQATDGPKRRWYQSDYFDLFTFQDDTGAFTGFQLCYDVERNERAFSWSAANGFFHDGVDDAAVPQSQASAILLPEGRLDSGTVVPRFTREAVVPWRWATHSRRPDSPSVGPYCKAACGLSANMRAHAA